jgi:ABC-type Zn uptake system ZnuABC Zn-binding protein ZnuA
MIRSGVVCIVPWVGVLVVVIAGCDRKTASANRPKRTEPVRVATTAFCLAEIAEEIGKDHVTTTWLRENSQSADALDPPDDQRATFRAAEVVITSSDVGWTFQGTGGPLNRQRMIVLDDLRTLPGEPAPATATTPAATTATTTAADAETRALPPIEPPARADVVGYLWLDPDIAKRLAGRIVDRISTFEVRWRDALEANARAFSETIDKTLAAAWSPLPAHAPKPAFLSLDPGYNAFARRFGFDAVDLPGSGIVSLPLSPGDAASIRNSMRDRQIQVLFIPLDTPPGPTRELQLRLGDGVKLEPLDAFGSSAASGRNTYAQILRYNLEQLRKALPAQVPSN